MCVVGGSVDAPMLGGSHVPLSDSQLSGLVTEFPDPTIAVAIIIAESDGDSNAVNVEPDGSRDRGLWQISSRWHAEASDECSFDPICATHAAYVISDNGTDFMPWASYKAGTYKKFIARAQAGHP